MTKHVRHLLFAGYVLTLGAGVFLAWSPRVFWTVVMPLVPIGFVLFGFHAWRNVCPIATAGTLGAKLHRTRRRLPTGWRRAGLLAPLGILVVCLSARLVATNGDPLALALFLGSLGLGAFVMNAFYGGRSFCHHACPVGVVERIYTDAADAFGGETDSRCTPCTGCTKGCADIDRGRAYDRSFEARDRRSAYYAFPGLVFAFYFYYWLRAGQWEAYFDGRWTEALVSHDLLFGPGFFFAPQIPAIVAAPLTLVGCALISHAFFASVERIAGWSSSDARLLRHRMLSLASFAAFNVFYVFAGAPTLRLVPGLSRVVAFVVPVVATLVLLRRLRRLKPKRPTRERRVSLPVVSVG